jgi:DMSO/TMAO reductase YedYZ molybdopterin-dependent catalytic subunit
MLLGTGSRLCSQQTADAAQRDAAQIIAGKDKSLIVLVDSPAVLETPLKMLLEPGLTRADRLFVRNNQQPEDAATMQPVSRRGWKFEITGLLNKNVTIDAADLESLDQVEQEMVLQCSGNSRALFSLAAQTEGTQWGRGGVGCVRFGGVLVSKLMEKFGLEPTRVAQFVTAEGKDDPLPDKEDFEHSLPIDDVLNRSLIALTMNGKPLPAIHGGPIRLVTPGIFGTMHMKWLGRLRFEAAETSNYNQIPRYRVPRLPIKPGTDFKFTLQNSTYNWGMKVKSIVLSPAPDERVSGKTSIQGIAFNDGQAAIETVLISLDQGASWQPSQLEKPSTPYSWTRFRHDVQLASGAHSVWTRAIDVRGRSQPLDGSIDWNPRGYEWNGVEKIDFVVS